MERESDMTDSERFQVSQGLHLDGEAWYLPRSPGRMPGRAGRRHEWAKSLSYCSQQPSIITS